jgi:hypothetical protein
MLLKKIPLFYKFIGERFHTERKNDATQLLKDDQKFLKSVGGSKLRFY